MLRESILAPTRFKELTGGWPDYIGYTDASGAGFGGIIFGELLPLPPTVFRGEWPRDITSNLKTVANWGGTLSISDLEMAGLLLLWLMMESICPSLNERNVALFSDNSPSVSWVDRLASKHSLVGMSLIRALALWLKMTKSCPLTPVHVAGKRNRMADFASRSFGHPKSWHCTSDSHFALTFNARFPLPNQNTWTIFRPSSEICMRVISLLRTELSSLDEWRRIPRIGRASGPTGVPMSALWGWTQASNTLDSPNEFACSRDMPPEPEQDSSGGEDKLRLRRSLQLSRPLARRSLWTTK